MRMGSITRRRVYEYFLRSGIVPFSYVYDRSVHISSTRMRTDPCSPNIGWPCPGHLGMHRNDDPAMFSAGNNTHCFSNFKYSNSVRCNSGAAAFPWGTVSSSKKSGIDRGKNEELWRDLFRDPSNWWDNRSGKPNARFPDFKHKQSGEGLWLDRKENPVWVASEVASITPVAPMFARAHSLSGYNKAGQYEKTMELFEQMLKEGIVLDAYVFVHVVNACAALQALEVGRLVHKQLIETGCELDLYVGSSLVDMYAKCGSIDEACSVFNRMPTRNVVAWTALILGCVKCGEGFKALELFQQMQSEGVEPNSITFVGLLNACASVVALEKGRCIHELIIARGFESDVYVGNSLVDMYAKCGSMEEAWQIFNKMRIRDVVSWNAMILGCGKCGEHLKAFKLFQQMQRAGIEPNSFTFVGVLNACAKIAALDRGRSTHQQIIQSGLESDVFVSSSLVDMYAKCGSIDEAWRVFNKMPTKHVVGWNALLIGFAMHGRAKEAVELFEQMFQAGSKMNEVTFICLLSACSHGGLVKEGLQYFSCMWGTYGVSPTQEHYACMVDMLGRAGYLDDAEEMVEKMPLEPCAATWMCLLAACRMHGNLEMGERVSKRVLELDPTNASGYVLLSNMYAAAGNSDSQAMVCNQRIDKDFMKQTGHT